MGKIQDTSQYPLKNPQLGDYVVGTRVLDGKTVNFSFSAITPLVGGLNLIQATLSSDTSYQDSSLIGASRAVVFVGGFEAYSSGQLDNINFTTGTVTFNESQTGKITILFS